MAQKDFDDKMQDLFEIYDKLFHAKDVDDDMQDNLDTLLQLIKSEYRRGGGTETTYKQLYKEHFIGDHGDSNSPRDLITALIKNLNVDGVVFIENCLKNYNAYIEDKAKLSATTVYGRGGVVELVDEKTGVPKGYKILDVETRPDGVYYSLFGISNKIPANKVRLHVPKPIIDTPSSSQVANNSGESQGGESQGGESQGRYNRLPGGGARRSLIKARRNRRTTMRNRRTTMRNRRSVRPLRKR